MQFCSLNFDAPEIYFSFARPLRFFFSPVNGNNHRFKSGKNKHSIAVRVFFFIF